jgi:hypothetical protein
MKSRRLSTCRQRPKGAAPRRDDTLLHLAGLALVGTAFALLVVLVSGVATTTAKASPPILPPPKTEPLPENDEKEKPERPPADQQVDKPKVDPLLAGIVDAVDGNIVDGEPIPNADQNFFEYQAYNFVLERMAKASTEELKSLARRDIKYGHMFERPSECRGQLVHVDCRIHKVDRYDPPKALVREGIKDLYEAWVFDSQSMHANPMCVLFTERPDFLTDDMLGKRIARFVSFDGIFFKKYGYKSGNGLRNVPLLIAHSIYLTHQTSDAPPISDLLYWFVVAGVVAGMMSAGMAWWFWRSDSHTRLALARSRGLVLPELELAPEGPIASFDDPSLSAPPSEPRDDDDKSQDFSKAHTSPFG